MQKLGERIRHVRGRMSQEAFAGLLGISKGALGGYERGENCPNADVILTICNKCKINVSWLMSGAGAMHAPDNIDEDERPENRPAPPGRRKPDGRRIVLPDGARPGLQGREQRLAGSLPLVAGAPGPAGSGAPGSEQGKQAVMAKKCRSWRTACPPGTVTGDGPRERPCIGRRHDGSPDCFPPRSALQPSAGKLQDGQDLGRRSFCVMRPLLQACPLSCMPAHGQGLPHALDGTGRYRTLSGLKLIA